MWKSWTVFPFSSFYLSVSDSCKILSSSSSSCFLILSSSCWACAESSSARWRSESGLEAEGELELLAMSTSMPSGTLLSGDWQQTIRSHAVQSGWWQIKKSCSNTQLLSQHPVPTCHPGCLARHPQNPCQQHPRSPATNTQCSMSTNKTPLIVFCQVSWPGLEIPAGSDGWRTAKAPRRCWTLACGGGCPPGGDNSQVPQTLRDTLETEEALHNKNAVRKAVFMDWGS